jgi:hypothetical protein
MSHRQLVIFRIGCWAAIVTAVLHTIAHMQGPLAPQSEDHRILMDTAEALQFELPGGGSRSLMEFMRGYSLTFVLFLVVMGGTGLIIAKRGQSDEVLMSAVARVFAVGSAALLIVSLTHWFIIPTICITFFTLCFALTAVPRPQ